MILLLIARRSSPVAGTPGRMTAGTTAHRIRTPAGLLLCRPASLSDCETVLACAAYNADGSTFVDDFAVAGGISGNGLPTTTATTTTPARDFVKKGIAHDDDAVSDDADDPD